jgi:hypothetical protein
MPNVPRAIRTERRPVRFATPYLDVETRSTPDSVRSRETRQDVRVGSVAVPRAHVGGDTCALDWGSDPRLLAILARSFNRERDAREKDQFRRNELDQPARRSGAAKRSSLRASAASNTNMSPF